MRHTSVALGLALLLTGCATPAPSNLAAYCTRENGERVGAASQAYFGGCPKESEGAFLAGLARGRSLAWTPAAWPYYEQMEQTERMLVAAASEADRERLRGQLRAFEFWAIRIIDSPGTYSVSP